MYFTRLPDHSEAGFDEAKHFQMFEERNIIFNAVAKKSGCDDHVGCLSLKTVFHGEEWYKVDGISYAVRPGQYLLLNQGQNYGSSIDSNEAVKSFSIFFSSTYASAIYKDSISSEIQLLDDPFTQSGTPYFFQKLHSTNGFIDGYLRQMISCLETNGYEPNDADEQLSSLLYHLLHNHHQQRRSINQVNALKKSTRLEVYRRLCIAQDIMHSYYHESLDLETISRYAMVSVPQLIRQFRAIFRQTPHQYLTKIRMERAIQLLQQTERPINDIATACGYEDHSAFTRQFKCAYKTAPEGYKASLRN